MRKDFNIKKRSIIKLIDGEILAGKKLLKKWKIQMIIVTSRLLLQYGIKDAIIKGIREEEKSC